VKRAGDVFSVLFDSKMMHEADKYNAFFSCWNDLVAKNGIAAAAAHSRIKCLEKGLVWIEVDHPGWKQILQTKESKLLSDFHYRFPKMDISGISITLSRPGSPIVNANHAPADSAGQKEPTREQPPAASVDYQAQSEGYEAIKDEALKQILMRLERSIIEREAGK
jgi:hypothetical protein